jgi:hypothetical protein
VHAEEMRRKEEEELQQRIAQTKRSKNDPMLHCNGEIDVEDIFEISMESEKVAAEKPVNKKVRRQGPTTRCYYQVEIPCVPQCVPSNDEQDEGFLKKKMMMGMSQYYLYYQVAERSEQRRQWRGFGMMTI